MAPAALAPALGAAADLAPAALGAAALGAAPPPFTAAAACANNTHTRDNGLLGVAKHGKAQADRTGGGHQPHRHAPAHSSISSSSNAKRNIHHTHTHCSSMHRMVPLMGSSTRHKTPQGTMQAGGCYPQRAGGEEEIEAHSTLDSSAAVSQQHAHSRAGAHTRIHMCMQVHSLPQAHMRGCSAKSSSSFYTTSEHTHHAKCVCALLPSLRQPCQLP